MTFPVAGFNYLPVILSIEIKSNNFPAIISRRIVEGTYNWDTQLPKAST
jgi:hypothetical protein